MSNDVPPLKIAIWQVASVPSNVPANLAALDRAAAQAKAAGADLLMTPEMFITGYSIGDDIGRLALEQPLDLVRDVAKRHSIAIVAGGPEALQGGSSPAVANSAWFIDDAGEVLGRHRKVQLFGDLDREHFSAGESPVSMVSYRGFNIAMLICFDVEYPETVRAAAHAGADFMAVPTAQMDPFRFVNEHLIRTRAWENSVYVAYANQTGPDGDFAYVGRSVIADPFGEHLAFASPDGEELLFATLDHATLQAAREQNPYIAQVRRGFYPAAT